MSGRVLMVQESRFRLLRDDGRGLTLVLAPSAAIEPQDLPPLTGRRVRLDYSDSPRLLAGIAQDILLLEEREARV